MRVVLDANVAIAAVAAHGLCEATVELAFERHQVVLGAGILGEIEGKLLAKLKVPPPVVAEFLAFLRDHSLLVDPVPVDPAACRDPADLMVLGLVAPGQADVILTGDKDLLDIGTFAGARILSPRAFWEANKAAPQEPPCGPMLNDGF